ncbi:RtcB family protein [candidate division KSB1 bacterium]
MSIQVEKITDYKWLIPKTGGMLVPGLIFADEKMLMIAKKEEAFKQVINGAHLPGILKYSMAMPDIHWGYGLPIGGVIGTDIEEGVITPGGVGYDINCGVRLLKTNLRNNDVKNRIHSLMQKLFYDIPCGVGVGGQIRLSLSDEKKVLEEGAKWAVRNGYGVEEDLKHTEDNGCMPAADPNAVSERALKRGKDQLGTLGSGNHFLEVQVVEEIFDKGIAEMLGIEKGQICVMIHCGSRGFGHQVCDDNIHKMLRSMEKYKIYVPDKQLSCAPLQSNEGKSYFGAMASAANYAWANRQIIMHWVRETFADFFNRSWQSLEMDLIYDVAHNIAKIEEHNIDGKTRKVCVHRKGATRSIPKGHPLVPEKYQQIGQPVIVPGDMGTCSYLLVGGNKALSDSFGSTCHGAGRLLSRKKAIEATRGRSIERELADKGIVAIGKGRFSLNEEVPEAYKDVDHVVDIVDKAELSKKVIKLKPIGVIKG